MLVRGLSQKELAVKAHTSENGMSELLNGRTSPRISTLEAVAAALDVPLVLLFTDDRQTYLLQTQAEQEAMLLKRPSVKDQIQEIVNAALAPIAERLTATVEAQLTGTDNAPAVSGSASAPPLPTVPPRKPEIVTKEHAIGTERIRRKAD